MNVYYEVRGTLAMLQIDHPPVNGLAHPVREALAAGLARAFDDAAITAVAITGTDRVFSGGADIREFNTPAMLAPPSLLDLIAQVERGAKPVIAAINGVCMGGGLELALGCHYRVATARATLALPEVKIGLIPGGGGTQRLPRAVGAAKALAMITGGEPITADDALASGLVDRIVAGDSFDGVLAFAQEVADRRPLPRLRERHAVLPAGKTAEAFFAQAQARVAQRAHGLTAPRKCVEAVQAACTLPFDAGLEAERALFAERLLSTESKALRHAFFAERAAAKLPDLAGDARIRRIARVALIGRGAVADGLAQALTAAGLPPARSDAPAPAALAGADCVLVAAALLADEASRRALAAALPADALVAVLAPPDATQIDALAAALPAPERVLGLQPGAPLAGARLLEVLRGARTSAATAAAAVALARRAGAAAVVARGTGIGRRMTAACLGQARQLIGQGTAPARIDAALVKFGMAVGPLALAERLGLGAIAGADRAAPAASTIDDAEIVDRCVLALVVEGARLLADGSALRAGDIDLVLLTGYGFPPAAGGPLFWARTRGLGEVVARMRAFAAAPGADAAFWTPPALLEAAAAGGRWPQ